MAQALIVIDIQEGLVNENPYDSKNLIANTKAIIQHFRDQNIEVIFIRHSEDEGLLATGSDNWQVYHELKPQKNEKIFNKYYNSIFKDLFRSNHNCTVFNATCRFYDNPIPNR